MVWGKVLHKNCNTYERWDSIEPISFRTTWIQPKICAKLVGILTSQIFRDYITLSLLDSIEPSRMHDFERNALISFISLSKKLEHSDEIVNQRQTDRHTHTQLDRQTHRQT